MAEQDARDSKAAQEATPAKDESPRLSKWPPRSVFVVVVVCALLIVVLRFARALGDDAPDGFIGGALLFFADSAHVNIFTWVLAFIAIVTLLVWFVCSKGHSLSLRRVVGYGTLALVALWIGFVAAGVAMGIVMFHFSGGLRPTVEFRFGQDEAVSFETPQGQRPTVDLKTTTPHDYPQFLGPNRDLRVEGIKLQRDWQKHPPRRLWRQAIGEGWSAFAAVNGWAVTLEQRGAVEAVTCYEIETGRLVWAHGAETRHASVLGGVGPRSTPTIHEGKVYALGATGRLWCLDGGTGRVIWHKNLWTEFGVPFRDDGTESAVSWGRAASPLIVDDKVVVPAGGPAGDATSLVAYNTNTGEKIWTAGERQVSYSSPSLQTIGGLKQIVIVNEDTVSGHDPNSGTQLWSHEWPGSSTAGASSSQAAAVLGDHVLLSKAYGQGAALLQLVRHGDDEFLVNQVWHNRTVLKTKFTNVVVSGEYAYGLSDGVLECVDLKTGERQWKRGRYGHGQILGVGDVILVQAESGEVVMVEVNAKEHVELGRFDAIAGKTWNNLCLYGPYLLVRNAEQAACFELPVE